MRSVLFYRNFMGFTGGHLNVWHYFNHVRHSPNHVPYIYFSEETIWNENNPWLDLKDQALASWDAICVDVLFLAGMDWLILNEGQREHSPVPIINFIQNVRHGNPDNPRYPFLKHKSIRICNSEEVALAIAKTRQVNGPVFAIPSAIDIQELPEPMDSSEKDCDLLIVAVKQPQLGQELMQRLERSDRRIELLDAGILRPEYLNQVNRAKVTVFLPNPEEGRYLPPLEGMVLGTLVVCPIHAGANSDYVPGYNCFRPERTLESILEAAETALRLSPAQMQQMLTNARLLVAGHDLMEERKSFLNILENVSQIW